MEKPNFDTQKYRDNLAEDLKEARKTDPELAEQILRDEKGYYEDIDDQSPVSVRYSLAEDEQKKHRAEAQENSPIVQAERQKNEALRREEEIKEGEMGKEDMLSVLELIDTKFGELEQQVTKPLHSHLAKEKDKFVYKQTSANRFSAQMIYASFNSEELDSGATPLGHEIYDKLFSEPLKMGEQENRNNAVAMEFKTFFLPEYQENGIGIIHSGNLYFASPGPGILVFSRTKEALLQDLKSKSE